MANLYRVRVVWTGVAGSPWYNNFYFLESGGTAQQAASAVATFFGDNTAMYANDVTFATEAEVAVIDEATGNLVGQVAITPNSAAGGSPAEPLPIANQGLLRWNTNVFVAGRRIRGRTFLPGTVTTHNQNGKPTATYTTAWNTEAASLIADPNSDFVIWSPTHGVSAPVVTANTWSEWSVLRSRRD